jgi:hypothetical protein
MMKLVAQGSHASSANARTTIVVERQPDRMGIASIAMRIRATFEEACLSLCMAAVI